MARYLNVGTEDYPFHPHGNNGLVIGRDGHALKDAGGDDLSFEKFAINIGPGQTWDVLFKWYDAENYAPSNPVPVTVPSLANSVIGTFYSGSPYLGSQETLPTGSEGLNQCGEYYIISHNHALFQITSWGVNMTGPDHLHADRSARYRPRQLRTVSGEMTMNDSTAPRLGRLRRTALAVLGSSAAATLGVLLATASPAAAANQTIDLYAVHGSTTMPNGTAVNVLGLQQHQRGGHRAGRPGDRGEPGRHGDDQRPQRARRRGAHRPSGQGPADAARPGRCRRR